MLPTCRITFRQVQIEQVKGSVRPLIIKQELSVYHNILQVCIPIPHTPIRKICSDLPLVDAARPVHFAKRKSAIILAHLPIVVAVQTSALATKLLGLHVATAVQRTYLHHAISLYGFHLSLALTLFLDSPLSIAPMSICSRSLAGHLSILSSSGSSLPNPAMLAPF
jgi:hypothetical protein